MSKRRTVYPAEGAFLMGIPKAPIIADSAIAARLIATGAFTSEGTGDAVELTDDQLARLDFYHNDALSGPEVGEVGEAGPEEIVLDAG